MAIGRQVKEFRLRLRMTVAELARVAGLSSGMLSKIENGQTAPSLATLHALSGALNVPVTALFRRFEERHDAAYVRAGEGLPIERRGSRSGHVYQLLGHSIGHHQRVEPFLIILTESSEVFPLFEHEGTEFIYMLEGQIDYHHAGKTYRLIPGDSLFFDSAAAHGPENLIELPIRFLSVIVHPQE